ncbi:MAG: tetratricopeptide repeat protein [Pirellulales bacterium]
MATFGELLNEARRLLGAGRLEQAEPIYRQLLEAVPEAAEAWHELGILHVQADRPEAAAECLQKAVALAPDSAAYHSNLGAVHRQLKRTVAALACFQRAVQLSSPSPQLFNNLGLALKDAGNEDEALAAYDDALKVRDDYANGHFNRANLLLTIGRVDEAIAAYRRAIELVPNDAEAHYRLGIAHYDEPQLDAALACWDRALALRPHYPEARRNRALVWLRREDYARGWAEWESRLECEGFVTRDCPQPRWDGAPVPGRTLLLHAEQGLGDTLHFIRYVELARPLAGALKVEVQAPLIPLLANSGYGRWLVRQGDPVQCDVHCPLLSVPFTLAERGGAPYWNGPYLVPDPQRVAAWERRLGAIGGFKVGIVWAGNPDHPNDRFRSVRLAEFARLATVPGVRLVSLQKGAGRSRLAEMPGDVQVIDFGDELDESSGAFMDTAAVIRHLDLVVTVDTAMAHLAGGMGAPVWLLLQRSPDWRWMLDGQETPWYPSMRLFRQRKLHEWDAVFADLAEQLRQLVARSTA